MSLDPFGARATLKTQGGPVTIFRLARLQDLGLAVVDRLPFSIRVLLEALLRTLDGFAVREEDVLALARFGPALKDPAEIPFKPARVVMQDFTGVPAVVDLAAMRSAARRLGKEARRINPLVPVDLVIDHSVQVDEFGSRAALPRNAAIEFERNRERYEFLRWGQQAFAGFRVVPPATGIVHQVNLEFLAKVVLRRAEGGAAAAFPDTLVGTDSHTTMINGLGVLGWGVGGIEAEAVMLGQPIYMLIPRVVGVRLDGRLGEGVTATDLTLTVTERLRKKGVVDQFVEFFGPGLSAIPLADRATIANMAPEYGATVGFFPVDAETLDYLRRTGRSAEETDLVERYTKEQGIFRTDEAADPVFSEVLRLDLGAVEPSLAGPKRPQDLVRLPELKGSFRKALTAPVKERGFGLREEEARRTASLPGNGALREVGHGAVVIAAITSCTNTSNPSVMLGAGILAKKAVERGLGVPRYVKTSLAPGSKVVTEYLKEAGLIPPLEKLGFHVVGYGCTTCIAAGTPVLLADNTATPIEQMPEAGGAMVFAPSGEGFLEAARQTRRFSLGERECVTLTLQDGRELVCTPDHEILAAGGRWVRADRLEPGRDRLVVGVEAPLDAPSPDERGYLLRAGGLTLSFETPAERRRSLAFARLLGYLLGDGSISAWGQGRIVVGRILDRRAVLDDVLAVTGKRPAASRYDDLKWTVVLPRELTRAMAALPGVAALRRIAQAPSLPECVLDEGCPTAMVREFLGGLFGADGNAPTLHRGGGREGQAVFSHPAFSQCSREEFEGARRIAMQRVRRLLARCGVDVEGATIGAEPARRAASSYPAPQDGLPRVEVRLQLADGLSFVERVGFRYAIDKALRASAAAAYWRTVARVGRQRLWISGAIEDLRNRRPEISFQRAREGAAAAMVERETAVFPHDSLLAGHDRFSRLPSGEGSPFRPLHRDACGFPSPAEFLRELGVREWFSRLSPRAEGIGGRRWRMEKEGERIPTFTLGLLSRRPAGVREVFDLTVADRHAFLAGTVAAHNCIGNSGPLPPEVARPVEESGLVAAAVLSGNRNFEGRIHPLVKANYLASPPLVVAYALAGTVDVNLAEEPLGIGKDGRPVFLRDVWPTQEEILEAIRSFVRPSMFAEVYANVFSGNPKWNEIRGAEGEIYGWNPASTYIQEPPFFEGFSLAPAPPRDVRGARCLALLGDSITTDHISPAGDIAEGGPAGRFLASKGVAKADFNSYGSRRGNDRVMVRGTFANIRLKNLLVPGVEGGVTLHFPAGGGAGEPTTIHEAAMRYLEEGVPLVVVAGKEYGSGSSRDWAAKGTRLLGVRAAIAESFERIHRSNLVLMGVLPLQFLPGEGAESLGIRGTETFDVTGIEEGLRPKGTVTVTARGGGGTPPRAFQAIARIDTPVELEYYRHGGILPAVLRRLLAG